MPPAVPALSPTDLHLPMLVGSIPPVVAFSVPSANLRLVPFVARSLRSDRLLAAWRSAPLGDAKRRWPRSPAGGLLDLAAGPFVARRVDGLVDPRLTPRLGCPLPVPFIFPCTFNGAAACGSRIPEVSSTGHPEIKTTMTDPTMQRRSFIPTSIATISFAAALMLGCDGPVESAKEPAANQDRQQPAKKAESGEPTVKDSAWTWGYFFAAPDKVSVEKLFGGRKQSLTLYRVDKVDAVRGDVGVSIKPGSTLVRVETVARLSLPAEIKAPTLLLQGVPQHLEYMTKAQREKLGSIPEFPPSKDIVAVVIPIRKSAAWWALAHDERSVHFQQTEGKKGHTAIGDPYVDRIHRKLYHTRYAVETRDHDFITYFEFDQKHTDDFKRLLAGLRDTEQNPEWKYVDREYEIWMTKVE